MEKIFYIILIIFIFTGCFGLDIINIKKLGLNIESFNENPKNLERKELHDYSKFNNMKEYLRRVNYNIMSAEEYYKKYYNHPIKPMKQNEKYKTIDNKKYMYIDKHEPILKGTFFKDIRDKGSHLWYLLNTFKSEDTSHMHLSPKHYVVHQ